MCRRRTCIAGASGTGKIPPLVIVRGSLYSFLHQSSFPIDAWLGLQPVDGLWSVQEWWQGVAVA